MSELQRYELDVDYSGASMKKHQYGDWIDADEALDLIATLRARIAELQRPLLLTERFEIHSHVINRSSGWSWRTVYQAWYRFKEHYRPACIVTIWPQSENFVEWIHTDDSERRKGVATEVLRAIESSIGPVDMEGVTKAGQAFCEKYAASKGERDDG